MEPQQKEIETEDPEPRVVEPTITNKDEPLELVDEDETPSYEEWQQHINQTTDELKTPKRLISRIPIKHNLRNRKRINLTMEKNKLDKEIAMPVGHNAPRDTQGLSCKKLIKTGDKQLWQESLCYEIGRLAQG